MTPTDLTDDKNEDAFALRAVLLDLDGTLVDSNDAHARAWAKACREQGFEVGLDQVRPLIGMGGELLLEALLGLGPDEELSARLQRRRREIFQAEEADGVRPFPQARALLERMRQAGLRLVLASSSKKSDLDLLVERAGLDGLVDGVTTADDVEMAKPARDTVVAALEMAGVTPAEALLLGDTPYDIKAAERAGVGVVALRSGGFPDHQLAGAIAIFDDPADLLARWEISPMARRGR